MSVSVLKDNKAPRPVVVDTYRRRAEKGKGPKRRKTEEKGAVGLAPTHGHQQPDDHAGETDRVVPRAEL